LNMYKGDYINNINSQTNNYWVSNDIYNNTLKRHSVLNNKS